MPMRSPGAGSLSRVARTVADAGLYSKGAISLDRALAPRRSFSSTKQSDEPRSTCGLDGSREDLPNRRRIRHLVGKTI